VVLQTKISDVVEKIETACDEAGKKEIGGVSLENPDPRLLDVRDGDFDEHVAMQPAAIAYFGVLKKESTRQLEAMKRGYDRWQKKKFQEARQALETTSASKKPTIADVEAFILMNNESQIEKWENDIAFLQEQADTMDVWYEAWRQKSYSLREHGITISDERHTTPHLYGSNDGGNTNAAQQRAESTIDRIRRFQKERKKKGGTMGGK